MSGYIPTLIRTTIAKIKTERLVSKTKLRKWGYLPSYKTYTAPNGLKYTVKYFAGESSS